MLAGQSSTETSAPGALRCAGTHWTRGNTRNIRSRRSPTPPACVAAGAPQRPPECNRSPTPPAPHRPGGTRNGALRLPLRAHKNVVRHGLLGTAIRAPIRPRPMRRHNVGHPAIAAQCGALARGQEGGPATTCVGPRCGLPAQHSSHVRPLAGHWASRRAECKKRARRPQGVGNGPTKCPPSTATHAAWSPCPRTLANVSL